jgi:hypothetical protein
MFETIFDCIENRRKNLRYKVGRLSGETVQIDTLEKFEYT